LQRNPSALWKLQHSPPAPNKPYPSPHTPSLLALSLASPPPPSPHHHHHVLLRRRHSRGPPRECGYGQGGPGAAGGRRGRPIPAGHGPRRCGSGRRRAAERRAGRPHSLSSPAHCSDHARAPRCSSAHLSPLLGEQQALLSHEIWHGPPVGVLRLRAPRLGGDQAVGKRQCRWRGG
jgi:hypothetical protein